MHWLLVYSQNTMKSRSQNWNYRTSQENLQLVVDWKMIFHNLIFYLAIKTIIVNFSATFLLFFATSNKNFYLFFATSNKKVPDHSIKRKSVSKAESFRNCASMVSDRLVAKLSQRWFISSHHLWEYITQTYHSFFVHSSNLQDCQFTFQWHYDYQLLPREREESGQSLSGLLG